MGVTRLNHAVLYVRDVAVSTAFYENVLGFRVVTSVPGQAAFLQAARVDQRPRPRPVPDRRRCVCLQRRTKLCGHVPPGWEVDTLGELDRIRRGLAERGALVGASDHGTTKALYAYDPDGLEFEVSWLLPADRITPEIRAAALRISPLDLDAEIEHHGAATLGGIGISSPAI